MEHAFHNHEGEQPTFTPLPPVPDASLAPERTVSFSVDCDWLPDYLNFAPRGLVLPDPVKNLASVLRRLLDMFARTNIRATFFCIASQLQDGETRAAFREAVARGHHVANHTLSHPRMEDLTPAAREDEIRRGHEAIIQALDVEPRGYRAPAYHIGPDCLRLLARMGYHYDSSACRQGVNGLIGTVLGLILRDYRPKAGAEMQRAIAPTGPLLVDAGADGRLLEWPIPQTTGLPYLGTMHSVAPKILFSLQTRRLLARPAHLHYELHLIEALTAEEAREYPWLPVVSLRKRLGARDYPNWLEERLGILAKARTVAPLEDLSAARLHLLHH